MSSENPSFGVDATDETLDADEHETAQALLQLVGNNDREAPDRFLDDGEEQEKDPNAIDFEDISDGELDLLEGDDAADEADAASEGDELEREQMRLFNLAARKAAGEDVGDQMDLHIDLDSFYTLFAGFEPNQNPKFVRMFPPRNVTYRGKEPLKPPKPLAATKVSLDLLPDQERHFRAPPAANKATESWGRYDGTIRCDHVFETLEDDVQEDTLEEQDEFEVIGNVTMHDLKMICADWDIPSLSSSRASSPLEDSSDAISGPNERDHSKNKRKQGLLGYSLNDEDRDLARKKPRIDPLGPEFDALMRAQHISFENPERATARIAKAVTLDMNDPKLLLEVLPPTETERKEKATGRNRRKADFRKDLHKRYNISNDEAYNLLKVNHHNKVRSNLSAMTIEHSLPARRLQYPFYKLRLENAQKRAFHRPHLDMRDSVNKEYRFSKSKHIKRKHLRGRNTLEIFATAEDLSVGDNSSVLLLEYSEEAPMMLSNFGMGSRLINYYRKNGSEDSERPKREIGETQVLLTQDRSPFSSFGHVDPGEVVPTIQNGLYRAPVFRHEGKSTDFLVGVSTSYGGGPRFYLRNIENLHTVGQQLPFIEVPGAHSRKVTDAARKRLRALAYRIHHKSTDRSRLDGKILTNQTLMKHFPGYDLGQTRSKMREFMKYERVGPNKDSVGIWAPQPGSVIPDPQTIRGWIKPEEVCALDSMQVGVQHLADLGFSGAKDNGDDQDVDEGANIELQLAPWRASQNFLAACQDKAMLQLHGEGDPTGRGEGLSFVKTSMKGGFQPLGESIEDKIQAKKRKDAGGHGYNVKQQQKAYHNYIRTIWERQKEGLSAAQEISDAEGDEDDAPPSAHPASHLNGRVATPRSSFGTPVAFSRHDDESASQFSKLSAAQGERALDITRTFTDKNGNKQIRTERVTNARVIHLYRKRKVQRQIEGQKYVAWSH